MSTMNMPVLLKTTYRFNTLSIKMPMAFSFFIEIEKNSKTHVKVQMTPNSQRHPKEKTSTARGTTISKFKLYDSIIITKKHNTGTKQTYRPIQLPRGTKNEPTQIQIQLHDSQQRWYKNVPQTKSSLPSKWKETDTHI